MSTYNIEMNLLNSSSSYDTLYPKVNLSNTQGTLSVSNGGTGVTTLDDLKSNLGISDSNDSLKYETGEFYGTGSSKPTAGLKYDITLQLTLNVVIKFSCWISKLSSGGTYGGLYSYPPYVNQTSEWKEIYVSAQYTGFGQRVDLAWNNFKGNTTKWESILNFSNGDGNGENGYADYSYDTTTKIMTIKSEAVSTTVGFHSGGVIGLTGIIYSYIAIGY